jgi:CheY-like chemotaxis protein
VFSNLLVNASKFTPEEGLIMVTVEREEPFVAVYIRDNGAGISADLLPYIFEVFTQGERTLAREEGGLGIGLALVKSLVELHGGQVSAISQGINQGAEFVVKLPIIQTPAHSEPENQQLALEKNDLPLRILLIDDNEDSIAGSALYFKMIGHQVETALNGKQGLAAALSFNPEVVLLDIGLPDMDGYQVAQLLRKQADGRPVLLMALSGYAPDRNSQSFKEANFDHYLIKPFDLNKLQTLLADYQRLKRTGNLSMP